MKNVIFACVHNAGRSQMAAAFFNHFADQSKAVAISAGTEPAEKIHDSVLEAMKEASVDLSSAKPQLLTQELARGADLLITMGCGETCPYVPGLERVDWPLPDPKDKSTDEVYVIRDQIKVQVLGLLEQLDACGHTASRVCGITDDDKKFLQSFEECSLGAKCWTHEAHVRMGWLVMETSPSFDAALDRIRTGIMRFNSSKNSIGYHETITVAFARLINSRRVEGENLAAFLARNSDLLDKNCLKRFYSAETLSSELARKSFVEPDLDGICD